MKPIIDAPQTSKAALTAPVNATHKDGQRIARVMEIYEDENKYDHLCLLAIQYLNKSEMFAEDIVADVFIDALKNWPTERFDKIEDLEAFICRCVINRSKNFRYRNRRLINIHDLPIDSLSTINPMLKLDLDMDVLTNMLPTKQREAFSLYSKGYTHEEIMQMLQLSSEGASKNLIYYAKKRLQKIWSDLPDDDPDNPGTSGARSKANNKASKTQHKSLSIRPGNTPSIKDLLNYLRGNEQNAKTKNAILLWIIEDRYAVEIISGLNYALNRKIEANIEARLKKGKENLRERLLDAMRSKSEPGNQSLSNKIETSFCGFTIEIDNQSDLPSTNNPYGFNGDWKQISDDIPLCNFSFYYKNLKIANKAPRFTKVFLNDLKDKNVIEGDDLTSKHELLSIPQKRDLHRFFNCYLLSIDLELNNH
jgi:DNA-directed RNA polymerase specialized sigma24 family protein